MNRKDWLIKQHAQVNEQIDELEKERAFNRAFEHKALLVNLKKLKLRYKTELESFTAQH